MPKKMSVGTKKVYAILDSERIKNDLKNLLDLVAKEQPPIGVEFRGPRVPPLAGPEKGGFHGPDVSISDPGKTRGAKRLRLGRDSRSRMGDDGSGRRDHPQKRRAAHRRRS